MKKVCVCACLRVCEEQNCNHSQLNLSVFKRATKPKKQEQFFSIVAIPSARLISSCSVAFYPVRQCVSPRVRTILLGLSCFRQFLLCTF